MKAMAIAKSICVPIIIGTLVSAQQASAESVFTPKGIDAIRAVEAGRSMTAGAPDAAPAPGALSFSAFAADTVETFDVVIEEEKGSGIGKQLAIFAIITAVVGYAVIELMQSDDEPAAPSNPPGKEPPSFPTAGRVSAAIIR